ncbi:hypothetical protein ACI2LC_17600 [Nonomuraea wenchangensis]|uniref:hypothetical protein n=1 Tax=Nonomuraea wenchangensis TaxID=568860 RepID=UPI00384AFEAD
MNGPRRPCRRECGADVIAAHLFGTGHRIELDTTPVVGGDYSFWSPSYGGAMVWRAQPRPATVSPPMDAPEEVVAQWDGRQAADGRKWFVEHRCGRTAAEIVEERRRRTA